MARHQQFGDGHRHACSLRDPASPRQRGANENTKRPAAPVLPKGTDLSVFSPADLGTRRPATQYVDENARLGYPSRSACVIYYASLTTSVGDDSRNRPACRVFLRRDVGHPADQLLQRPGRARSSAIRRVHIGDDESADVLLTPLKRPCAFIFSV